jgi:hypothetical protein
MDESFLIELKNQKSDPVTVSVIEHLYRAANWEITHNSANYDSAIPAPLNFPLRSNPNPLPRSPTPSTTPGNRREAMSETEHPFAKSNKSTAVLPGFLQL